MSEAEYLDSIYPYTEEYSQEMRCTAICCMSKQYDINSKAKVGSEIECPYCYKKFINELLQIIGRCGHIEKVSIEQRNFTDNPDIDEMIYLD